MSESANSSTAITVVLDASISAPPFWLAILLLLLCLSVALFPAIRRFSRLVGSCALFSRKTAGKTKIGQENELFFVENGWAKGERDGKQKRLSQGGTEECDEREKMPNGHLTIKQNGNIGEEEEKSAKDGEDREDTEEERKEEENRKEADRLLTQIAEDKDRVKAEEKEITQKTKDQWKKRVKEREKLDAVSLQLAEEIVQVVEKNDLREFERTFAKIVKIGMIELYRVSPKNNLPLFHKV